MQEERGVASEQGWKRATLTKMKQLSSTHHFRPQIFLGRGSVPACLASEPCLHGSTKTVVHAAISWRKGEDTWEAEAVCCSPLAPPLQYRTGTQVFVQCWFCRGLNEAPSTSPLDKFHNGKDGCMCTHDSCHAASLSHSSYVIITCWTTNEWTVQAHLFKIVFRLFHLGMKHGCDHLL